jgi:hypothetical protein
MANQTEAVKALNANEIFVKMVISAWESYHTRVNKLFETLSDEQLLSEIAPGRNRGIYLLGHLTAVSDSMLPLLGFGEKMYPHLDAAFLTSSDKSVSEIPSIDELKNYWNAVGTKLTNSMNQVQPDEWFTRHGAVSEEDFIKEPFRNKLNIVINRTNHMSYHLGQLILLVKK